MHREIASDRSGSGILDLGGSAESAKLGDGALALDDHGHDRPGGNEVDELGEEALLAVLGIVALGETPRNGHHPERDDPEPLALDPRDDLAGQAPLQDARLEH